MTGSIMRGIGSFYTVLCDDDGREYTLRAQKKLRRQHMTPMVGDRVRFTPGQGEEDGWLEEILPRKSQMIRPSVANVDMLMLVMAAAVYISRFSPVRQRKRMQEESVLRNLPQFVNNFVLLLNAGMVPDSAFEKIVEESISFRKQNHDYVRHLQSP